MALPAHGDWAVEDFDPGWPDFMADPYPYYERLRRANPVHRVARSGAYWVISHELAAFVLQDKRFSARPPDADGGGLALPMLNSDPPDHSRLRSLVGKAFTPRTVEHLRPKIAEIAAGLLDQVRDQGRMDVVHDFAFPLPAMVIAEMLGVPWEDRDRFKEWSHRVIAGSDAYVSPEAQEGTRTAIQELAGYFARLIEERRAARGSDMISALIEAEEGGDRLRGTEILSMCTLLLLAGHETTSNLIANGTLTLLRHPDQLERLRRHEADLATAVEEMLRYESPVQRRVRFVLEEVDVGGVRMEPGQTVAPVIAAANRDPAVFADPERFDIARTPNPHLAFGKGIHFCLGAALARLEGRIAFTALLELPDLELEVDVPRWAPVSTFRRLDALPVRFRPGGRAA